MTRACGLEASGGDESDADGDVVGEPSDQGSGESIEAADADES